MSADKKWQVPDFMKENQVDSIYKFLASVSFNLFVIEYFRFEFQTSDIDILLSKIKKT